MINEGTDVAKLFIGNNIIEYSTVFLFFLGRKFIPKIFNPLSIHQRKIILLFSILYTLVRILGLLESFKKNSLYTILNISPNANKKIIKKQFRKISMKLHPDKIGDTYKNDYMEFQRITEILINDTTRFAYDRLGPVVLSYKNLLNFNISDVIQNSYLSILTTSIIPLLPLCFTSIWQKNISSFFWKFFFILILVSVQSFVYTYPKNLSIHLYRDFLPFEYILILKEVIFFLISYSSWFSSNYPIFNFKKEFIKHQKISNLVINESRDVYIKQRDCIFDANDKVDILNAQGVDTNLAMNASDVSIENGSKTNPIVIRELSKCYQKYITS